MKHLGRIACLGLLASAANTHATTFVVTRTDDPAPNGCNVGDCSLREAILAANAASATLNEIQLGTATYHLDATVTATGSLLVTGAGSANTRIETAGTNLLQLDSAAFYLAGVQLDAGGEAELSGTAGTILMTDVFAPNATGILYLFADSIGIEDCDIRPVIGASHLEHAYVAASTFVSLNLYGGTHGDDVDITVQHVTIDGSLAPEQRSGITIGIQGPSNPAAVRVADAIVTNRVVLGAHAPGTAAVLAMGGWYPRAGRLTIERGYFGGGYGHLTEAGERAADVAEGFGLTVEPTYTAKAFACAVDRWRTGRRVVFIQTYDGRASR